MATCQFRFRLRRLSIGGRIDETGAAVVHKGETVLPAGFLGDEHKQQNTLEERPETPGHRRRPARVPSGTRGSLAVAARLVLAAGGGGWRRQRTGGSAGAGRMGGFMGGGGFFGLGGKGVSRRRTAARLALVEVAGTPGTPSGGGALGAPGTPSGSVKGSLVRSSAGNVTSPGDRPGSNALGVPRANRGFASPGRAGLGKMFDVTVSGIASCSVAQADVGRPASTETRDEILRRRRASSATPRRIFRPMEDLVLLRRWPDKRAGGRHGQPRRLHHAPYWLVAEPQPVCR